MQQPLWPDARRVRLWERFHCRYSATSHPKVFTNEHWVEYSYGASEMDMNEYSEDWATNTQRSSRGVSLESLASPHSPYRPRNNNDDKRNSSSSSQGSPQKVDSYGATVRERVALLNEKRRPTSAGSDASSPSAKRTN